MKGIHDCDGVGEFLGGGGFETSEPIHRDHLDLLTPGLRTCSEPGLERLLGAALDHVEQPGWAGAITDRGQVNDHGDVFVAVAGVAPHVLIDTDHANTIEPGWVINQHTSALSQNCVVSGVSGHPEAFGDPGHRQVLHDDGFKCPSQASA